MTARDRLIAALTEYGLCDRCGETVLGALEPQLAEARATIERLTRERDDALALAERRRLDRAAALDVQTREGLTASEWVMRTAIAERELARLRPVVAAAERWRDAGGMTDFATETALEQAIDAYRDGGKT